MIRLPEPSQLRQGSFLSPLCPSPMPPRRLRHVTTHSAAVSASNRSQYRPITAPHLDFLSKSSFARHLHTKASSRCFSASRCAASSASLRCVRRDCDSPPVLLLLLSRRLSTSLRSVTFVNTPLRAGRPPSFASLAGPLALPPAHWSPCQCFRRCSGS